MSYLTALLICAAAAVLEGLCAGREPMAQLRATRQPAWSPPGWAWVAIGLAWYALCFTALARLVPGWPRTSLPILLLAALMTANAAANLFLFRVRRLDLAAWFLLPYWLLYGLFMASVCGVDRLTCLLFGAYGLYLIYATAWTIALWRMNRGVGR